VTTNYGHANNTPIRTNFPQAHLLFAAFARICRLALRSGFRREKKTSCSSETLLKFYYPYLIFMVGFGQWILL